MLWLASWCIFLNLLYAFVAQGYLEWRIAIAYIVGIFVIGVWIGAAQQTADRKGRITFNLALSHAVLMIALGYVLVRAMYDVAPLAESFAVVPAWVAPAIWYALLAGCVLLVGNFFHEMLEKKHEYRGET